MSVYIPAHINQYRDAAGKPWPKSFGKDYNGLNCWAAMGAEGADAATRGKWKPTPPDIRTESGDRTGGANRGDVARVLQAHGISATTPQGVTWQGVLDKLATGRYFVWLATDYDQIPDAKSCAPNFDGLHALLLFPGTPDNMGRLIASDPLCEKPRKYDAVVLRAAAEKCMRQAASSGLQVCYIKQVPEPKPIPKPTDPPPDPRDAQIADLTQQLADVTDERDGLQGRLDAVAEIVAP